MNRRQALQLAGLGIAGISGCSNANPGDNGVIGEESNTNSSTPSTATEEGVPGSECVIDRVPTFNENDGYYPREYPELNSSDSASEIGEWALEFERAYHYNRLLSVGRRNPLAINIYGEVQDIQQMGDNTTVGVEIYGVYEFTEGSESDNEIQQELIDRQAEYIIEGQEVLRRPSTGPEGVVYQFC